MGSGSIPNSSSLSARNRMTMAMLQKIASEAIFASAPVNSWSPTALMPNAPWLYVEYNERFANMRTNAGTLGTKDRAKMYASLPAVDSCRTPGRILKIGIQTSSEATKTANWIDMSLSVPRDSKRTRAGDIAVTTVMEKITMERRGRLSVAKARSKYLGLVRYTTAGRGNDLSNSGGAAREISNC